MDIKVLGGGCAKCHQLESLVKEVVTELAIEAKVEHVADFIKIASYGVMATPGLVINEKVVFSGSLPSKGKVIELITSEIARKG